MTTPRKTNRKKARSSAQPKTVGASSVSTARAGAAPVSAAAAPPNGVNAENWDASVSDTTVLGGRCAANAAERHVVLDHAVSNVWAAEDIGTIRRVESNGRCMWVMW